MPYPIRTAALALLATTVACADVAAPAPSVAPTSPVAPLAAPAADAKAADAARRERLARRLALALRDPALRTRVQAALDASPFTEHKLPLAGHIERDVALAKALAATDDGAPPGTDAGGLELYFPVAAHRAAWQGDAALLVMTAGGDDDRPVAFDLAGRRVQLDHDEPPPTPVLAVVPAETDFRTVPSPRAAASCGGGGWDDSFQPLSQPQDARTDGEVGSQCAGEPMPGLYLTYASFRDDFEPWFKGNPEFELHFMPEIGGALESRQCVGELAHGPYHWDQNELEWQGNVLVASAEQLRLAGPGPRGFRIMAFEDDQHGCVLKVNRALAVAVVTTGERAYGPITGLIDSLPGDVRPYLRAAPAVANFLEALWNWFHTDDDIIGNAISRDVTGEWHPVANWVLKGEHNITNGWLRLERR
ncbi:MAG: hypothetical protein NW201_04305 [Gemmatimonadales bacterium]|nr:hypothetical protein [Gemmatimonadales bacterium]